MSQSKFQNTVVMIYYKKLLVLIILLLFVLKEMLTELTFWYMSKDDAINMMNNSSLIDKMGVL